MTLKQVLKALKDAGTAQNRKVYARHGATGDMFGVSYAALGKLKKKIGRNHEIAVGLWNTGNHDAQVLAIMIGDPAALSSRDIDAWSRELSHPLTGAFAGFVAQSPHAPAKLRKWIRAKGEWVCGCGWILVAHAARESDR